MRFAVCLTLLAFIPTFGHAACRADQVEFRTPSGTVRFTVEVADDAAERARGLMNRESLPSSSGMLFVYEHPQAASFWMKNTLIPLDMIFMDQAGVVKTVHANAVPHDETAIPGGDNILSVVEINGGLAARLGITPGSVMRHPSVPEKNAAWPCE
ncbi:DUF192 domain-containing protein [Falsirhodobacter sp. alg1]|uniref:DUF192 domain-containing protein n=1 Tax=Falsirhodobacter sp. alg1 TaxID=1472418 RepID=UPI0005EF9A68|nr:DUF192 domain-containing protein [Falsirhodobacter sp. alg1]